MDKKSILILLDTFPSLSETFIYTLIQNLIDSGYAVRIMARKRGIARQHPAFAGKVSFLPSESLPLLFKLAILMGIFAGSLFKSPRRSFVFIKKLGNISHSPKHFSLLAYQLLPLYMQESDVLYLPFGGLAAKYDELFEILSVPIVFSLRGSDIHIYPLSNPDYRTRLGSAINKATAIHCVSQEIKTCTENLVSHSLPKAHVIYTALSPQIYKYIGSRTTGSDMHSPIRIVSVGRLDWGKGYEHGMVAAAELRQRGLSFVWEIFGDGEFRIAIQWAIRDMGLEDLVYLRGPLSHGQVFDELVKSDIYFHPAVHEGISNAVLEAMAVGLPVVATNVGGMSEAIDSGTSGFLVSPRDWRSMADDIETLAADPQLCLKMGKNASRSAKETFNPEQQIQGFSELLKKVMQEFTKA